MVSGISTKGLKFSVNKESFYNGLNAVIKAVSSRGIQPVLSNILIETKENKIRMCATDLDISIEVNVEANIVEDGSITLPAKKILEIVSKLPDEIISFNLNDENNLMKIVCKNTKFDIIGISSNEFPLITYPEVHEAVDIEITPFLNAIKETVFAVANYDTNSVLSGVFCKIKDQCLEMASTDGNRLVRTKKEINNENNKEYSVIIPSKTLLEFSKILTGVEDKTVSILIGNGQICFKLSDRFLTSRVLEGQYPDYNKIIPSNYENIVEIKRDTLISSIERTAIMVNDRTNIVKFLFNENTLTLSADTPDLGDSSDEISIEYEKEELVIAYNYKYVLDALKAMNSDFVKIELGSALSSTIFKPVSDNIYLCLVMPVQIK